MSEQDRLQRLERARRLERLNAARLPPADAMPETQEEETYLQGVSRRYREADFAGTAAEFMPELRRRQQEIAIPDTFTGKAAPIVGEQLTTSISQLGRTGGALVGEAASVVVPDVVRETLGNAWDYISSTAVGQQIGAAALTTYEGYQELKKTNPALVEDMERAIGTSLDMTALFSPRPDLINLDKKVIAARAAGTGAKLSKERQALQGMLEPETHTFTAKDRIELRGPLRTKTWIPNEFEEAVIDVVQTIPGIKPYGTITGNFNTIQKHVDQQASKLNGYVSAQNRKIDLQDLQDELGYAVQDFLNTDVVALASGPAKEAVERYIKLAQKLVVEEGGDLKGVLAARRRFDNAVHNAGGTIEADVATYQAMAAKTVRGVLNDYLKANTKGNEVHHLLDQQHRSLTALDNLVNKRNKEARNSVGRFFQNVKENTGVTFSSTLLGVLATGASVAAPSVAAPLAGAAIATGLSSQIRRYGKAAVLKSYAELLSAGNKASKVISDPTKLEALELDRLVIIDLMNQVREYEEPSEDGR